MAKYALIVRDTEPPQGRGKIAHTLTNALALQAAGHDVKVLFEGQGVEWLDLFQKREDKFTQHYGARFDEVHSAGLLAGACNFCTTVRFKVAHGAEHFGVPLYGDDGQHGSLITFLDDGYQVLSF
ncbi:MAG: DsrE family protein [Rhodothermaceae bacterium]|nr:DsrE family protein [Rhodothermaceae bacterium]